MTTVLPIDKERAPEETDLYLPDHEFRDEVDWLLRLKNSDVRQQFNFFNGRLISDSVAHSQMLLIMLSIMLGIRNISLYHNNDSESTMHFIFTSVSFLVAIANFFLLVYSQVMPVIKPLQKLEFKRIVKNQYMLKKISWYIIIFLVDSMLVLSTINGACENIDDVDPTYCYEGNSRISLPMDIAGLAILLPTVHNIVIRGSEFVMSLQLWSLGVVCILFSVCYIEGDHFLSSCDAVIYIIFSFVMLISSRRNQLFDFFINRKLRNLIHENNKNFDRRQANEMRSMIANVAHDLKTPLASLLCGIEIIEEMINKLGKQFYLSGESITCTTWHLPVDTLPRMSSPTVETQQLMKKSLLTMDNSVQNMRHTASFMLMTINRCIDYTKAIKGMKLKANNETINVMETLMLPLNCMRGLQTKVSIRVCVGYDQEDTDLQKQQQQQQQQLTNDNHQQQQQQQQSNKSFARQASQFLNSLRTNSEGENSQQNTNQRLHQQLQQLDPTAICSYIITDKQWLQENILCLLSNAVKYSVEGEVTLRLFLEWPEDVHARKRYPTETLQHQIQLQLLAHQYQQQQMSFELGSVTPRSVLVRSSRQLPDDGQSRDQPAGGDAEASDRESESENSSDRQLEEQPVELYLTVEVEDRGIGLSGQAMQTLFSPFKQAQRLAGGTGLGLYSLRKRVEALRGKCGVRTRRDGQRGALFWFSIPYRPDYTTEAVLNGDRPDEPGHEMITSKAGFYSLQTHVNLPNIRKGLFQDVERYNLQLMRESADAGERTLDDDLSVASDGQSVEDEETNQSQQLQVEGTQQLQQDDINSNRPAEVTNAGQHHGVGQILKMNIPPLTITSPTAESASAGQPVNRLLDLKNAKLHILVVDDSPAILKMTGMMLKLHGHHVSTAENGAIAVETISKQVQLQPQLQLQHQYSPRSKRSKHNTPNSTSMTKDQLQPPSQSIPSAGGDRPVDVILMDLQMPVMDGLEATKRIRAMELQSVSAGRPLPIIGVSANSDYETEDLAINAGMHAFIGKPFSINTFYAKLQQILLQHPQLKLQLEQR